jgi:hypothetical protein
MDELINLFSGIMKITYCTLTWYIENLLISSWFSTSNADSWYIGLIDDSKNYYDL